jgi:hypothetical protein
MAAHRYWSARAFTPAAGRAIALSEFHLFAAGARVDATATLSAAVAPASGSLADLKDDVLTTGARWPNAQDVNLLWDFGAGGGYDIDAIRLGSSNTGQAEFPIFCSLWFSDDAVTWTQQAVWAADYPGPKVKVAGYFGWHPNDIAVAAQLGFVGANGSTVFTDDVAGNVWTPAGSAQIKTDQFKWGGSAGYFNGTTDYLSMPAKASLNMGTGDFCMEVWFRAAALMNNFGTLLSNGTPAFGTNSRFLMVYGTAATVVATRGRIGWGGDGSSLANPALLSTTVVTVGAWYRVKVMRIGVNALLFVNDVLEASANLGGGGALDLGLSGTRVGSNGWDGAAGFFQGHIGELRITRGVGEPGDIPAYVRHPVPKKTSLARALQPEGRLMSQLYTGPYTGLRLAAGPIFTRGDFLTGVLGKGNGRLRGFTLDYVNPLNKPYPCRVALMREVGNLVVREQWSKADGSYDFQYIDELQSYTVIAYYEAHGKRAVVTDGLTLANGKVELMP